MKGVEYNLVHHLVQPVSNPVAVQLAYLLRYEVGGYEREATVLVSSCKQVSQRPVHVAELLYLHRLYAHVIDVEHLHITQPQELGIAVPTQMGNMNGIHDRHTIHSPVVVVRYPDYIEQVLERPHYGGLAVAAQAAQHHPAPSAGGKARSKASDL